MLSFLFQFHPTTRIEKKNQKNNSTSYTKKNTYKNNITSLKKKKNHTACRDDKNIRTRRYPRIKFVMDS